VPHHQGHNLFFKIRIKPVHLQHFGYGKMNKNLSTSKNIGLVLSGGGVRGMAHIGVLQAMKEFGIEAKNYLWK